MFALRSCISPELYVAPEHLQEGPLPKYVTDARAAALYASRERAEARAWQLLQRGFGSHEVEEVNV